MQKGQFLLLVIFFSSFTLPLHTQETQLPESRNTAIEGQIEEETEKPSDELSFSAAQQRLEMEIRTSTITELAAWSRSLGLSEAGTREDLSKRIRDYFELPHPLSQEGSAPGREITIESAHSTEYFRIDAINEEYARFKGEVVLSLKDDEAQHRISADEILFNRTRNILNARGSVRYEKETQTQTEIYRGEHITVYLDDFSSIFLDGSNERIVDNEGNAYLFSGTVISRTGEDTTTLANARISNANNPDAFWSINASRLYLLPGNDFAILNAILKVGEIPLLYLPFLYYPADSLFFHPVLGYRTREGGYVQTTTYILGRPRSNLEETTSLGRIFGNTDNMETEWQGLFLRSTGRMAQNREEISLKVFLDYYVNLGVYTALDLYVPKTGILNPLNFSLGLGFTRTVSMVNGNWTPYINGASDWNRSNLFSLTVPFRYRMQFQSSVNMSYGTLTWNFPFYSDPYVNRDFMNRLENMELFDMLLQGMDSSSPSDSVISSYQWHLGGNLNFTFPALNPYLSRLNISALSATVNFRSKTDINNNNQYDPGREFYYPDRFTIYNISVSLSGTPFAYAGRSASSAFAAAQQEDLLEGIGTPVSPWADEINTQGNANTAQASRGNLQYEDELRPPVLSQRFNLPAAGNFRFSVNYQISPSSSTELAFLTDNWKTYEQVNWADVKSVMTSFGIGSNSNVSFNAGHSTGLFSHTVSFSGGGTWRFYPYLNDSLSSSEMEKLKSDLYKQTNYSTSYAYSTTLSPFYQNEIFSSSNFQYNIRGTLVRSQRSDGTAYELRPHWGTFARQSADIPGITSHRLTANVSADIMSYRQNLSLSMDLPPMENLFTLTGVFNFWISATNISLRVRQHENRWIADPVRLTETLSFARAGQFNFFMEINPEANAEVTAITSSLTLWNFKTSFRAEKMYGMKLEQLPGSGGYNWVQYGENILRPRELSFSYEQNFPNLSIANRIDLSLELGTSLNFNLHQHTNSNFNLRLGIILKIPGFLDFKFSFVTENNVIFRYFKGFPGMDHLTDMYLPGRQNNLFLDLFDSFNFFDAEARRRSGFKMSRFELSAVHFLGDWRAEFSVSLYPYLDRRQTPYKYDISSDFTFLVQWRPISEIKSHIEYKGGENPRWIWQ